MLCLSTIEPSTLELLKKLQQLPELRDTRLVGGTALALQLGHRKSIDLDFFGTINCDTQELVDAIKSVATLTILKESPHIHIYLIDGIKVDIVNYKYPWLDEVVLKQDIRMASFKDIAAMKITAVVGRGSKKDFIDFAFLLRLFSLDEILSLIRFVTFCQDDVCFCPLFRNVNGNKIDEESAGKIQDYLERTYRIRLTQNKVFEKLKTTSSERSFNPVQEFITQETWDGQPRIATTIIDYLGAEENPLVREQTKLWFVAAVARVFRPGCKLDNVLTLPGPQGIGKSTFFKAISGRWFNDSFSFASGDKEKVETITNGWIIEISELNGLKRANDADAAKAFLSRCSDYMRPAYGHKVVEFMRHNVFAATTNETNFLQGDNGNRRWWIIPVKGNGHV